MDTRGLLCYYGLLFPIILARFCRKNHSMCKNKKNILENLSCLTRDTVSRGKILPQRCGPLSAKIPVFSSSSQLKRLRHFIRCHLHLLWVWSDIKFQRGTGVGVAQNLLYALYVCPTAQQQRGTTMPLRYNYDKPEKPRRIKGFEVFSLIFSSFSKPKNHTEISRIAGGVSLTTNE